ncbi:hypothetical protein BU25DRAFT_485010 [Macroventuria anomochaeta]|uniref:Uncharacterized protein n=1 Tax=Macroventuria anomochaeta TaxID=301207 RepID=A0ACB6S6V3_9PLEO|nr:uncharacterized protein BU25DRAFT_485010 [Macroventuria anomochaeta]KAF2629926.1 hypothetical protein BU25DRAFT_485010 [Macroventuria anomochaeta]
MRPLTTRAALLRPSASSTIHAQRARIPVPRPPQCRFSTTDAPATQKLSPRWLSDVRAQIGKCIMFGINDAQTSEAGSILQEGHVNNVMYNRYAESARVNWTLNFAAQDPAHKKEWLELMSPKSIGLILRSIKTDYKFPMKWPDRITVLHKLRNKPEQGTDHFILDVLILSEAHRRAAARCIEDIVVYDYRSAKKSPLPPFMIDKFKTVYELQEQAKEKNSARVRTLLDRVRELEKSSWDRPDAVENFGSAGKP